MGNAGCWDSSSLLWVWLVLTHLPQVSPENFLPKSYTCITQLFLFFMVECISASSFLIPHYTTSFVLADTPVLTMLMSKARNITVNRETRRVQSPSRETCSGCLVPWERKKGLFSDKINVSIPFGRAELSQGEKNSKYKYQHDNLNCLRCVDDLLSKGTGLSIFSWFCFCLSVLTGILGSMNIFLNFIIKRWSL